MNEEMHLLYVCVSEIYIFEKCYFVVGCEGKQKK